MKNILVPTDFSENSKKALEYAFSLLKDSHCNFYIHHVVTSEFTEDAAINMESSELMMDHFLNEIQHFSSINNHTIIGTIESNYFIESLRNQVIKKGIDFIVMGTKGSSTDKKWIVGPKTGDVIKKVKCSALVIPAKATYKSLKNVLFSTDYTILFHSKVLTNFSNIIKLNNTSIKILHISNTSKSLNKEQKLNKQSLKDYFNKETSSFYQSVNECFECSIEKYVDELKIDMVTLVAKNLNIFEQVLFKPTVNDYKYHKETPFLILHE